MAEFEFSGQYDQELLQRAIALGDPRSRTAKLFSFVLMGLFIFNLIWAISDYLAGRLVTFVELAILLIPLAIIAYLIYHTYQLPVRIAAELWQNPASRVPLAGRVTPGGIVVYSSKPGDETEREIPWTGFTRIRKSEDLVVMTSVDKVLYILPLRFFRNQEDWMAFLELVSDKVGKTK